MPTSRRLPSEARKTFGVRVRARRHALNLTLEDLAERADLNWSYIAQVERGIRNVSIDNMAALADGLNVELRDLL